MVNADSRYLYRHLTIGVAKPTLEERRGVRHHLIDVFEPADFITIAQVQQLTYAAIENIIQRGKLPILVGGTPLYMNAIVEGWRIPRLRRTGRSATSWLHGSNATGWNRSLPSWREWTRSPAERSGQNPRRVIQTSRSTA